MIVLDLDMDYFMEMVATNISFETTERLSEDEYGGSVWTECRVRQFLEQNLGVNVNEYLSQVLANI